MPPLRELQHAVMDALLEPELGADAGAAACVALAPCTGGPEARLRVYRAQLRLNFLEALRASFPVVRRLGGDDYFDGAAFDHHAKSPSRHGDLNRAGAGFAHYLAARHGGDAFEVFAEVARLEWLVQEASLAAAHAPLDLERLRNLSAADCDAIRFELHPSLRLFSSPYPAVAIWEANVDLGTEPPPIDLRRGGERCALLRSSAGLRFLRLTAGEEAFLSALRAGQDFATAVAAGDESGAPFDPSTALQRFVAAQAIVGCRC